MPACLVLLVGLVGLAGLAACTHVPELDERVGGDLRSAPYPALVPLERAVPALPRPEDEAERLEAALTARADRLQRRAGQLQAPIIDAQTRKRMEKGVAR